MYGKRNILNVINKVLPFLIAKREEALLMKDYCSRTKLSLYEDRKTEEKERMDIYYALKEAKK